ncbi:MAG: BspA family leucine-rich repeat surface protein [Eubacterium sp.]|nr:BspA family leucine-rich repeat surface protein [Eubacterium sp.]
MTSLLWHLGSLTSEDTYGSITGESDGIVNYLKNLASTLSTAESGSEEVGKSVSFYASIDPNRIPIDIYFMPYTTKQKVSVSDAETVQKDDGRTGGKVSVLYNEVSETVKGFPTQIDVSPNENEDSLKVLSEEQREDVVRFNDEWIFKNDSGSSSSYEKVDTSLKDWTENWAKTQVEASKLNKDSEASVTFAAPADICKTAFLSVVNETESSESTGNTTSSPKMTLNDTDSVEVTFSEYEYDHKRYELRGENDETRVAVNDDYSIFKNTELLDTQHVSNMSYMFASCTSSTNESTGDIRIDNATNIAGMFNNCNTLKDIVLCGDSISTEGKLNNTKANYTYRFVKMYNVPDNYVWPNNVEP